MSSSWEKRKALKRRRPRREPKKKMLVVVEGKVTEAGYFRGIKREIGTELLIVDVESKGGVPKTLVERAVTLKREADRRAERLEDDNERYDEIWCVHDVDEHPKLLDARQQAAAHGLQLAISNPCFELWALLHFEVLTSHQERARVCSRLKRHLPEYEKELPFEKLCQAGTYFKDKCSSYFTALSRAEDLEKMQSRAGQPGANPSTTVHHLTERIRELTKKAPR